MLAMWILCCFCAAHGAVFRTNVKIIRNTDSAQSINTIDEQLFTFVKNGKRCDEESLYNFYKKCKKACKENAKMPGCAVFVPNTPEKTQEFLIYWAIKCTSGKENLPANNNPYKGGNLLAYTNNMHTERQLLIAILEDAILAASLLREEDADFLQEGINAKPLIPWDDSQINLHLRDLQKLEGNLYIYVDSAPCYVKGAHNNNFTCVEYYQEMAKLTPNVKYHIYFPSKSVSWNEGYFVNQSKNDGNNTRNIFCNYLKKNNFFDSKDQSKFSLKELVKAMKDTFGSFSEKDQANIMQDLFGAQCENIEYNPRNETPLRDIYNDENKSTQENKSEQSNQLPIKKRS